MTMPIRHPIDGEGVTVDYLNGLLQHSGQAPSIADVTIEESRTYGDQMVSTAARVLFPFAIMMAWRRVGLAT